MIWFKLLQTLLNDEPTGRDELIGLGFERLASLETDVLRRIRGRA